uniref:Uncharacterized protein n=1 Tax=Murine herpesvirus TaxID=1431748 RepID=A0A6M4EH18_9BETA
MSSLITHFCTPLPQVCFFRVLFFTPRMFLWVACVLRMQQVR